MKTIGILGGVSWDSTLIYSPACIAASVRR
jgi:aspartate/glutamate racemase